MKPQSILFRVAAAAIFLARASVESVRVTGLVHEPLIGCWDDQFNGTAGSFLLVTESELIISYAATPPLHFAIMPNYTFTFVTGSDDTLGLSVIAANDPNDPYAAGKFSDFDMMIEHSTADEDDGGVDLLYYCQIDYDDPTAVEAAKSDAEVNYTDLGTGCSGFPWSRMRRSANGCGNDLQIGNDGPAAGDDSDTKGENQSSKPTVMPTAQPTSKPTEVSSSKMASAVKYYVQAIFGLSFSVGVVMLS